VFGCVFVPAVKFVSLFFSPQTSPTGSSLLTFAIAKSFAVVVGSRLTSGNLPVRFVADPNPAWH